VPIVITQGKAGSVREEGRETKDSWRRERKKHGREVQVSGSLNCTGSGGNEDFNRARHARLKGERKDVPRVYSGRGGTGSEKKE